jgi:hypothetical protein
MQNLRLKHMKNFIFILPTLLFSLEAGAYEKAIILNCEGPDQQAPWIGATSVQLDGVLKVELPDRLNCSQTNTRSDEATLNYGTRKEIKISLTAGNKGEISFSSNQATPYVFFTNACPRINFSDDSHGYSENCDCTADKVTRASLSFSDKPYSRLGSNGVNEIWGSFDGNFLDPRASSTLSLFGEGFHCTAKLAN